MKWNVVILSLLMVGMLILGGCVIGPNSSQNVTLAPTPSFGISAGYCGDGNVQSPETCANCSVDAGICPVETPPALNFTPTPEPEIVPVRSSAPPNQ